MKQKQTKTIYLGNLPQNTTEENIKKLFTKFGDIVSFRFAVSIPELEIKPDFVFIQLSNLKAMQKAVKKLNDFYYQDKFLIAKLIDYPSKN